MMKLKSFYFGRVLTNLQSMQSENTNYQLFQDFLRTVTLRVLDTKETL